MNEEVSRHRIHTLALSLSHSHTFARVSHTQSHLHSTAAPNRIHVRGHGTHTALVCICVCDMVGITILSPSPSLARKCRMQSKSRIFLLSPFGTHVFDEFYSFVMCELCACHSQRTAKRLRFISISASTAVYRPILSTSLIQCTRMSDVILFYGSDAQHASAFNASSCKYFMPKMDWSG